ncbi:MAG: preprotein translocase subunit YajC [Endomicrobia bacterium]|nr:preprotein translocase subunit YajC [Endomicrobiia bacterium]MCL2506408.1 preprotein translocase subunit YajC [Endomicrobiia bacterium]
MKKFVLVLISLAVMPSLAFANEAGGLAGLGGILPFILIFVFFYIFLIMPQRKKAKEHQLKLKSLRENDKVITAGGIYGTISRVSENDRIVGLRVADGVIIKVEKDAIATIISEDAVKVPEVVKK